MQIVICKRSWLIIIILILLCKAGYSQSITIATSNASLEKVFSEIEKQTGFRFIYNSEAIQKAKQITVIIDSATLQEAMNTILMNQPIGYTISDSVLVIRSSTIKSPGHKNMSEYLLLLIIIGVLFIRIYYKAKKPAVEESKIKQHTATKKESVDAFDALISLAQLGNISIATKRKMIQLWLSDQGEVIQKEETNSPKTATVVSEAESCLKTAVLGYHSWELLETISDTVSE